MASPSDRTSPARARIRSRRASRPGCSNFAASTRAGVHCGSGTSLNARRCATSRHTWRSIGLWSVTGLIEPNTRRKRLPAYKRWERGRPMELWQMDVVGGVLLEDGTEAKVLTGVDDHSRFCVCAGVMTRATGRAVCGFFAEALERHGVPDEILTDIQDVSTLKSALLPAGAVRMRGDRCPLHIAA